MSKYFHLPIGDGYSLVAAEITMAEDIFKLVDSNREHLRTFLDFVDASVDVTLQENYIKMKLQGSANGTDKLFFIASGDQLIGTIDLHAIHPTVKKAEIGYWVHTDYTKKGVTSKAVRALCQYAFDVLNLNKLTIMADVRNIGSNKVAQSCGFTFLGTHPQDALIYDEYQDMNEYYLLKESFR